MATTRVIKTAYWLDPWVQKLDPEGKLFYLFLLTNHRTNLAGIYEITVADMVTETKIKRPKVMKLLRRFGTPERKNFRGNARTSRALDEETRALDDESRTNDEGPRIIYRNEWMCLTRFIDHQADNPKIDKGIERAIANAPEWAKRYAMDRLSRRRLKDSYNPNNTQSPNASPRLFSGQPPDTKNGKNKNSDTPLLDVDDEEGDPQRPRLSVVPPPESDREEPKPLPPVVAQWLAVFPKISLNEDQMVMLADGIRLERKLDAQAFEKTKELYKGNYNPRTRSYLPDRIATVIKTFNDQKAALESPSYVTNGMGAGDRGSGNGNGKAKSTRERLEGYREVISQYPTEAELEQRRRSNG